jgi:hypothetical protein
MLLLYCAPLLFQEVHVVVGGYIIYHFCLMYDRGDIPVVVVILSIIAV